MKTLDKIYVKKEKNNVVYSLSVQYDNGGEEYIRKDALLEWAKKELNNAELTNFDDFGRGEVITWTNIINKINSL